MRISPYQPTSTKGRFKGKSIPETMCCPINYGGHILLDVYGWLMDCIIHDIFITSLLAFPINNATCSNLTNPMNPCPCRARGRSICQRWRMSSWLCPRWNLCCSSRRRGPRGKQQKIGASHVCMKNGLECAVWSEFWILMKMTSIL